MEEFRGLQDQIYVQVRGQNALLRPSPFAIYREKRGLGSSGQCRNFFFIQKKNLNNSLLSQKIYYFFNY